MATATRLLPDGRQLVVATLLYGRARLSLGPADGDAGGAVWEFPSWAAAARVWATWDGQGAPPGGLRRTTSRPERAEEEADGH